MIQRYTIKELISTVLQKMSEMDYSPSTITSYRRFYNRFEMYAYKKGEHYFTEELGTKFLSEFYGCTHDTIRENSPDKKLRTQVRYIRVLGDYQIHGVILRRKLGPTAASILPPSFQDVFETFRVECYARNLSVQGTYSRCNRIRHFIFFADEHGVSRLNDITPELLSNYVKTFINHSSKGVAANLVAVRSFLRYLFHNDYTDVDLTDALPAIKNNHATKMPNTWKEEDLKKVFDYIDRGNPTGKRDYAILLMIARYGIRGADIKHLKLEHLNWVDNTISFNQSKTSRHVVLPLLGDVGWAIIDYLKNGRPKTNSTNVFVRHQAPFEEFGPQSALNRILIKYVRLAGIPNTRENPYGLHSLRHTLASTLLAENVPLPVISEILGHASIKSTDIYLHIDHKRLVECALNPEEVYER